jgi:hypothetical protein
VLTTPVTSASVFSLNNGAQAFLVGNEPASGVTHTYVLTPTAVTEVPTKAQHTNATAIQSPMVTSILVVGGANEIESFTPAPP